jgi:Subtilase family
MPPSAKFQHLPLLLRYQGSALIRGGGTQAPQTKANKQNAAGHSGSLRGSATNVTNAYQARQAQRNQDGLPVVPDGIPVVLQVDPSFDLDILRDKFGFEIVSEQEDGFVIVASEDLQLSAFLQMVNEFATQTYGSANVAKIHRLFDDPNQGERLKGILSERLFQIWPVLQDNQTYICDVGIVCLGTQEIPTLPNRGKRDSDANWAHKEAAWSRARAEAYEAWDNIKSAREGEITNIVTAYGGSILSIIDNEAADAVKLPDSFTVRVQLPGRGLRDLVLNHPYIFEVVEPDDIDLPQRAQEAMDRVREAVTIRPPSKNAPAVCVIDSGIQEEHYLLEPAIDKDTSHCFLPSRPETEVADQVPPAGHGTRVSGAVLYGETIPRTGVVDLPCWIQNARVLDEHGNIPITLFPPAALRAIVERYHRGPRKTRIFNHSIGARWPCRQRHMSSWAAEIDNLTAENDILFIVSAGNISESAPAPMTGIKEHLAAGRAYPDYLSESASRVSNPGQCLHALTVGSVAYGAYEGNGWRSLATNNGHPSAFSRSGLGVWGVIKPEVVEYGGDELVTAATPPDVGTPSHGRDCYPELVRSTLYPPGPAYDRDGAVGTSFAVPKVSRIAARLQDVLPEESCLLYRALIVQSARWPEWAANAQATDMLNMLRRIGYGIPDMERATTNTEHRTTLISAGETYIKAGECHIYQVPIPASMRGPADEFDIRIEVTLSYVAAPRRTRRNLRRYLSTWVEWKSSKLGEEIDAFRIRVLKGQEDDGTHAKGMPLPWMLDSNPNWGTIRDVKRNAGTVQKDWAIVKSNALPEDFCISVVGHKGWSHDPDSTARYALTVSFEVVGQEIAIYEPLRVAVQELQAEIEAEIEVDVEAE